MSHLKSVVMRYFKVGETQDQWSCRCGKSLTQRKGTGWSNLFNHIKSQHPDWKEKEERCQPSIDKSILKSTVPESVKTMYNWMEWVCMGLKPFNFVEDPLTRKFTSLKPICVKTFKKNMSLLVKEVEAHISKHLPDKFALVIDGWSKSSTHFLAIFAAYTDDDGVATALLAFSPMPDETQFTAKTHYDFIAWVLESVYGKSFDNVVAIIGDNCETNKAICNMCKLPLIGCASHRFNLAVKLFLEPYDPILNKVNILMGRLKGLKLSGLLRDMTHLRPIQRNITRWSSTADMVSRYLQLKHHLAHLESSHELIDHLPSVREANDLAVLDVTLSKLNSVTKALQRKSLDLGDVRTLFDEVIKLHPLMTKYLAVDAKIVHSPHFENAVVKILDGQQNKLSAAEAASVVKLKAQNCTKDEAPVECTSSDDFVEALLKRRKVEKEDPNLYMDCHFLLPTSNIVERFFSLAGQAFSDDRQRLLPLNLEMQLFLNMNKAMWNEETLMKVMVRDDE